MGFRFRKSIKLGNGFRINLSKSGIGYSWGTKGARITKTAKGTTRTTVGIPGTGLSYTTESHKVTKNKAPDYTTSTHERTSSMKWIDFALCFFFGIFGIHKFREGKAGIGLLYLFTGGLLGIGWIIDCVKYFVAAIRSDGSSVQDSANTLSSVSTVPASADLESTFQKLSVLPAIKRYWRWLLSGLLVIFIFATFPSFSGFLFLIVLVFIIPIPKWQAILEKYVKAKYRSICAGILTVLALFTFPIISAGNTAASPDMPVAAEAHIHIFADATCLQPKTCSECGETEGEALGHMWLDATCFQPKICSTCGETEGEALGHTWVDATCLRPKSCSICNAAEGLLSTHSWADATCLTPQTCTVCKAIEGELADHAWQDATCITPKTCSVCSLTEGNTIAHTWEEANCLAPKTCSYCKTTEGGLGSHSWESATCQAPKTCSVCKETEGSSVDHAYRNHVCIYCDRDEPTVWIPQSGSRYHSKSSCSGMDDPSEVPISTAKSRGFTPCKRCYG